MTIAILQALVGLILVGVGIEMANKPPNSDKARWCYRGVFIFLGLIVLVLAVFQYKDQQGKEDRTTGLLNEIKNKQAASDADVKAILGKIAENPSANPDVRRTIIQLQARNDAIHSDIDTLESWGNRFSNRLTLLQIQKAEEGQQEREARRVLLQTNLSLLYTSISIFTNVLNAVAKERAETIIPNIKPIPIDLPNGETSLGDIHVGTNSGLNFTIIVNVINQNIQLFIEASNTNLRIWKQYGTVQTVFNYRVSRSSEPTSIPVDYPGTNYASGLEETMKEMIFEQHALSSQTNK